MSNDEKDESRRESLEPDYDTPAASLEACLESVDREIPENVVYVGDHDMSKYSDESDESDESEERK